MYEQCSYFTKSSFNAFHSNCCIVDIFVILLVVSGLLAHEKTVLFRCHFPGCNYQTHFSENLKKHSKIHISHPKVTDETGPDHSYTKPTRRSKRIVNTGIVHPNRNQTNADTNQSSSSFPFSDKHGEHTVVVTAQYTPYPNNAPSTSYRQAPMVVSKMDAAAKPHGQLTELIADKQQQPMPTMAAVPVIPAMPADSNTPSLYPSHQQEFHEIGNNSSSYISLWYFNISLTRPNNSTRSYMTHTDFPISNSNTYNVLIWLVQHFFNFKM